MDAARDAGTGTGELVRTRAALHAVAELVLAGPQYRRSGDIRLRATPGGFGTVTEPDVRVDGVRLVAAEHRLPLDGRTCAELAAAAGLAASALRDVYHDGPDVGPDETLHVDPDAAALLADAFARGDAALRAFAPQERPVLWPEHFDIGITAAEVNYGVSPGDANLPEPYAYVGPWRRPATGDFWNYPFGAARPLRHLADIAAFYREGRQRATAEG
jgi:hypothetical protein